MTLMLLVLTLRMRAVLPPEPHRVPLLAVNQEETDRLRLAHAIHPDYGRRYTARQFFRP